MQHGKPANPALRNKCRFFRTIVMKTKQPPPPTRMVGGQLTGVHEFVRLEGVRAQLAEAGGIQQALLPVQIEIVGGGVHL